MQHLPVRSAANTLPPMPDDSIRIEYNQSLQPLEELLEGVERPGDFFVSGGMEIPMPKIEVEGVGVLSFPVPESQIAALVQQATRAPYGRGEKTILDESVRKVWQLPADKVRVGGKSWAATFDALLQQVATGLGCDATAVSAELYKLLVYDRGGFFQAHRDTEKTGGMFGTLVIVLPCAHRGGELVLRHAGREAVVDLGGGEISEVKFAAFYADCEHEVKPITDGNRVCLIYNLILQRGGKGKCESLRAPDYEKQIAAAAELLEANLAGAGAPAKIAWLLEHQYSPEGLSFAGLKAADAARAQVLAQAAERAGCVAHLGIVHIEESGAANPTGYDYGYRRRRWGRDDEDEEDEDDSSEDFEVIEVCDWRHYVAQWRDQRDRPVEFGEIPLEPGELLPDGALDDEKPDAQRLMEASGNEGASFERSYHRAALVLWRRERYAEVLLQAGVAAVLPLLKEKVEACSGAGILPARSESKCGSRYAGTHGQDARATATARKEAVSLARQLVKSWAAAPDDGWRQPARPDKRDGMLNLLAQLGDVDLLGRFISEVVTRDYDGSDNDALVECAALLGASGTGKLYAELARQHTRHFHAQCVDLLHGLVRSGQKPLKRLPKSADADTGLKPGVNEKQNGEWRAALTQIAEAIVGRLDEIGKRQRENEWMDWRLAERAKPMSAAFVAKLLNALEEFGATALRAAAAEKFAARTAVFDPVTILVPALGAVAVWDDAATRLWEHSAEFLLKRSGQPPEAPRDWRQNVKLSCSCADCRELQAFTLDPVQRQHRFRVKQSRRQHLHQQIEHHGLDMTHETERVGSPQTLVCTKDRRSYRRRCEEYRKDIAALASLAKLAGQTDAPAELTKRIVTARALADEWSPAIL